MIADDRLLPLLLQYGLVLAVVLILLGQLGVPTGVPAELVLLLAGGYAVRSLADLLAGLALVGAADVIGSLLLFFLVRRGTRRLAKRTGGPGQGRFWSPDRFRHRGAIFLVRLLPFVRIYGTVGSGLLRTRTRDFLVGSVPAGVLWAGTPMTLGFLLREHIAAIVAGYPAGTVAVTLAIPGLLLSAVMVGRLRRGEDETGAAAVPILARLRRAGTSPDPVPVLALQTRPVRACGPYPPVRSGRSVPPYT